ncbi:MAG: ABC transporter ATP-binding protein [Povalibacter sp.]
MSLALRIDNVHAAYGQHRVLRGVTLHIEAGEWFCLLGPNGAGKSTLLDCISTQVEPASGDVLIGETSVRTDPELAKRALGFAAKPEALPALLTGRECLQIYAYAKGLSGIDAQVLELSESFAFTKFIGRCVDTYSLGTRQKLCVLLALIGQPRLIVLDEAFNGLDPGSSLILKRHLRERIERDRCSVLLATHSLDIVEHYADRAALLIDGQIARVWDSAELHQLRSAGGNALEESVSAPV